MIEQTQSESIDELAKAMVKVQIGLPGAKPSVENTFYKNKYANLADCLEAGREILTENGLCVLQTLGGSAESPSVITTLMHVSGQWIKGEGHMTPDKKGPQGTGSAITYARRYGYSSIIGLHQEDDDGEKATDRKKKQAPIKDTEAGVDDIPLGGDLISEKQRIRLQTLATKNDWATTAVQSMLAKHGFNSSKIVTKDKYKEICEELEHGMEAEDDV